MKPDELFCILDSVDSTNNYAMAKLHDGLAQHGQAWFTTSQTGGKGQREKKWYSRPGENMALSVVMQPGSLFQHKQFLFSAFICTAIQQYISINLGVDQVLIKWPNDIYWRDRKAGGILIENKLAGLHWNWAVVGIGLNVNQETFPGYLPNPVSLKQIKGKSYEVTQLAKGLHAHILQQFTLLDAKTVMQLTAKYNQHLYKKGQWVKLKKGNAVFTAAIQSVNEFGQLLIRDNMERKFEFGEVEWIIDP